MTTNKIVKIKLERGNALNIRAREYRILSFNGAIVIELRDNNGRKFEEKRVGDVLTEEQAKTLAANRRDYDVTVTQHK